MGSSIIVGFTLSTGQLNVTMSPLAGLMACVGEGHLYSSRTSLKRSAPTTSNTLLLVNLGLLSLR